MVFASLTFLYFFLPLSLLLYYATKNFFYRNSILTLFSLWFYAWGEPVWIILLLFSAFVDWINALIIEKYKGTQWAKWGLVSSAVVNLGLLAIFKYSGFIYENINAVFGLNLEVPEFSLPIGISFYSFHALSYTIDVYRGQVKAQKSYWNFLMCVSMYHQLVAGPIVRYAHIAHEIEHRKFNIADISAGINRFCIGLFKKVCIANVAGDLVTVFFGDTDPATKDILPADISQLTFAEGWYAILMYSIQIYFDFSGYSDMAIGLGRMYGFHYRENFIYPYISRSATEFWRRWHVSLGSFFRDYLYIPLGGNKYKPYRNLFIVWFLTGLWHGASWNFIIWGLYFGFLILIERLFLQKAFDAIPRIFSHIYLLLVAVLGWAIFYFEDSLARLGDLFRVIFGLSGNDFANDRFWQTLWANFYWMLLAFILCMPVYTFVMRKLKRYMVQTQYRTSIGTTVGVSILAFNLFLLYLATAMLVAGSYNPFIYYRF
ncbi:MAG TPA: MBOAT family O-acyltransferase [Flavobacteriales bacterium]|nr:MBOAT family O-acyltransferase [Flavobacteriales bacterium]